MGNGYPVDKEQKRMCNLSYVVASGLRELLAAWTTEGRTFDTMDVRNALREKFKGNCNGDQCVLPQTVRYVDVFPEIWHTFRKGEFVQPYVVRTKNIVIDGKQEITVEYVPVAGTILKKVQEKWARPEIVTSPPPESGHPGGYAGAYGGCCSPPLPSPEK